MPDDNRNLEFILIGLAVGAIATYLIVTVGYQIKILSDQLSIYNQYALAQQYTYPQIQQPQPTYIPPPPQPKRIYAIERDEDGYIKIPE